MTASSDGKLLVSRHHDQIRVWDSATAVCIHTFGCALITDENALNVYFEFSPNSLTLAYATENGDEREILLQSMQTWSCCTFFDRSYRVTEVGFSRDGELLVSYSTDKIVRLWNIADGSCISMLKSGYFGIHVTLCLSRTNNLVALESESGMILLWNVATGSPKTLKGRTNEKAGAPFSSNDLRLAFRYKITGVAFSTDARLLASDSGEQKIRLWDVETASCRLVLECHHRAIRQVVFSPNSKILASFCSGFTNVLLRATWMHSSIRLWDTKSGQCRHIFSNLPDWVKHIGFSPCGTYIQTNAGNLAIPTSLLNCPSSTIQRPPAIFVRYRWIHLDETPIFWLPPEYHPAKVQIFGTTIYIATKEDKFIILRLDLDKLKRIAPTLFHSTHNQDTTRFWAQ
jgi:WD40 repeat protein